MPLRTRNVVQHKQRRDSVFAKSSDLNSDAELLANWGKYTCVLVSGFVEQSVRSILTEYAKSKSAPEIEQFVGRSLRSFTNAKLSKIPC